MSILSMSDIIYKAFEIGGVPLGIVVGILSIWFLYKSKVEDLFTGLLLTLKCVIMYWAFMICGCLGAILIRLPKIIADEHKEEDQNPIVMGIIRNIGYLLVLAAIVLLLIHAAE